MQRIVFVALALVLVGCVASPLEQDLEAQPILSLVERERIATSSLSEINLTWVEGLPLRSARSGLVTSLFFKPGEAISSDDAVASVDGQKIVALNSDQPFYRSLSVGNRGDDVAQLHTVLRSTGDMEDGTDNDQIFGARLVAAVKSFNMRHFGISSSVFDHTKIAWIESPVFFVGSVLARAGEQTSVGTEIATSSPELQAIDFRPVLRGDGHIRYDGSQYEYQEGTMPEDAVVALGRQLADTTVTSISVTVETDLGEVVLFPVTAVQEGSAGPCVYDQSGSPQPIAVVGGEASIVFVETDLPDGDSVIVNPTQLGLVNCAAAGG